MKPLIRCYCIIFGYIIKMFEQSRQQEITLKIKHSIPPTQKQQQTQLKLPILINQTYDIYVPDLVKKIRQLFDLEESSTIFYYNYSRNCYLNINGQGESEGEADLYLPMTVIASESMHTHIADCVNIRIQSRISDQLRANPQQKIDRVKRSPERVIAQAFQIVQEWRCLYTKGSYNQKGEHQKVTLETAAIITGVPRKSLEDYYLLFRNGFLLGFNFKQNSRKKVGVLRNFVKQKKKQKIQQQQQQKQKQQPKQKQKQQQKQLQKQKDKQAEKEKEKQKQKKDEKILIQIRKQIFGMGYKQYEEELFRVVSNVSSDEDQIGGMIFEN